MKAMQITFIERIHKRRIINIDHILEECNSWIPSHGMERRVQCTGAQFDNTEDWLTHLDVIRHTDILVRSR